MIKNAFSIFNDILGPIMTGPSSSHTAGCARIGKMARTLYGKEIGRAQVVFDARGSYPNTYIGQGSNYGFTGGLLGFLPDDPRLKQAIRIAIELKIKIDFKQADLGAHHPNQARIDVFDEQDNLAMSVMTYSTGGGMFEIVEMDGFSVSIKGNQRKAYIACYKGPAEAAIQRMLNGAAVEYSAQNKGGQILFEALLDSSFDAASIASIKDNPDVLFVRVAEVILPVALKRQGAPVFANAEEALAYNEGRNLKLWQLAVDYECSVGEIEPEDVFNKMRHVLEVMRESAKVPAAGQLEKTGFLEPTAFIMLEGLEKRKTVNMGLLQKMIVWSTAVMENSCAHNIIVAAPTAGSSGVIPAAILGIGEEMGLKDKGIIEALLAAGVVGAFIANQATFGAEVAGCQAENGAASAMAAAGVIQMLEGTVEEGFQAASLALQNLLGLICDPIGGLTEIPCVNRNVVAAVNAVTSANMVVCGYNPVIPLDEVIIAMLKVGKLLPRELRCTCEGGLCDTPTAKRIALRLKETGKTEG